MTKFGIAELCSPPIVNPARKREVTCPDWPLRRHLAQIYGRTTQNKTRGYLCGTAVKTFGRLYNEFLPTKRSIVQENGVRRAHEVPTRQGGVPSTLVDALCPFQTTSYFPKFLNIPKRRKNAIRTILESVYLPYHIPIPFRSLKRSGKCPLCIPPGLQFQ